MEHPQNSRILKSRHNNRKKKEIKYKIFKPIQIEPIQSKTGIEYIKDNPKYEKIIEKKDRIQGLKGLKKNNLENLKKIKPADVSADVLLNGNGIEISRDSLNENYKILLKKIDTNEEYNTYSNVFESYYGDDDLSMHDKILRIQNSSNFLDDFIIIMDKYKDEEIEFSELDKKFLKEHNFIIENQEEEAEIEEKFDAGRKKTYKSYKKTIKKHKKGKKRNKTKQKVRKIYKY
jgi:hypothetical protein